MPRDGSQPSDLIIANANIFTSDAGNPLADAVAVKDRRIVYVGDWDGVTDFAGPETRIINGKGKMLTPGFVDNHCHVLWISANLAMGPLLYDATTVDELKEILQKYADENPDHPYIFGIGWKYEYMPDKMPDKNVADYLMPDRPMILMSYGGNTGLANSKMLALLKERNPEAFRQLYPKVDEGTGEPAGLVMQFYAWNPFDFFSDEEMHEDIKKKMFSKMTETLEEGLSYGITTFNDIQIPRTFLPMLLKFRKEGGLDKVRIRGAQYLHPFVLEDEAQLKKDLTEWIEFGRRESDEDLVLGESVKLYIEGVAASYTSLLLEPYHDRPDYYGKALWTQEDFNRVVEIIDRMGIQACTHGTGDGGIRRIINAYERALKMHGTEDARHSIEHCVQPTSVDQKRMAELGIYAAMQPCHFFGDETLERVLGPEERISRLYPWRSLEKLGIVVSFGSDWCAGPLNPFYGLLIAGTRMNYKENSDWGPDEEISLENAIRHYTIDAAKTLKMERNIGSIEVGKYADLVLWSQDLLKIDSLWFLLTHDIELGELDDFVIFTMKGGEIVYHRSDVTL